jgi:hypothetical protein
VFGGLIGMLIVDPASGAMWRIDKFSDEINVVLSKSTAGVNEPTLKIIDIKDVPENLKANLLRIN